VEFQSHIDGSREHFTPESVIAIERALGADVIMQFDHVIPGQSELADARDASERSIRWLERARRAFELSSPLRDGLPPQALFPILQGGIHAELRRAAAGAIRGMDDWPGYAIGGLSVGEAKPDMYAMLDVTDDALPRDRPRYLMGVGFPEDLIEGARRGIDLFDCVAPTRMGRTGTAFTSEGRINVRNASLRTDARPLDERCQCATWHRFTRAYVRHLFVAEETLGLRLLSLHNVHFLLALMRDARAAIRAGTFDAWSRDWLARYHSRPVRTT
jgi:queuine tRNA-ribosyltransferase